MKVFLDTNFVIDLFRFKIDPAEIFDLLPDSQLFVLDSVVRELKLLAGSKKSDSKPAKIALEFVETLKKIPTNKNPDKAFLDLDKHDIVATNDIELRKKLTEKKIKTIYLRARKHLELS